MTNPSRHFKEELQELIDHRLDEARRAEVEAHLAACSECCRELEALRFTKRMAASGGAGVTVPPDLAERIARALRADADAATTTAPRPSWKPRRWLFTWATAIAVAVAAIVIWRSAVPDIPRQASREFHDVNRDLRTLRYRTVDVRAMEAYFTRLGAPFTPRVFDLGMMRYQLIGGRMLAIGDEQGILFAYRGPKGQVVTCEMFRGKIADLPSGAVRKENKGIAFYVYRIGNATEVFWIEGRVLCGLTSDMPEEDVVQLAFAKAMIVAPDA